MLQWSFVTVKITVHLIVLSNWPRRAWLPATVSQEVCPSEHPCDSPMDSEPCLSARKLITETATGPSRCFPFWQELLACYVMNTDTDDMSGGKKCLPMLEDYYECLHHKKEVSADSSNSKQ